MRRVAVALAILVVLVSGANAVEPDEILKDPVLETRARELSKELRCLVCQNQSIDDSSAPLARDLRVLVRERLVAGDSNDGVLAFVTARYGDFVLLRPPFKATTWLLWLGPAAILALGLAGVVMLFRRRRPVAAETAPLSQDERQRLDSLLDDRADR